MQRTISNLFHLSLVVVVLLLAAAHARATAPTATTFSVTVSTVGSTLIQLQGGDVDGTPLVFSFNSSPVHGTVSGFDSSSGYFVYTPTPGYVGTDGIFFVVTSGGQTSSAATCSITVSNAKTRIIDTLSNPDGSARAGVVTFILTQKAQSPGGLITPSSTASAVLSGAGQFDVSVYPSTSLTPQAYYQVWFAASGSIKGELVGVYSIPATTTTTTLEPHRVTNTALSAQYVFASAQAINALISAGAGFGVSSFNARTGSVVPASGDYSFSQISGSVTDAQVPDTITLANFNQITTRSASDLSSGTLPDARFPATLPAASGVNLTSLNASNLASGTIPDGRFPGILPAMSGQNLENLNGSEIISGIVPAARLGSGTASSTTILRGNNTWVSPVSLGLISGSGVTDRLSYWDSSNTLASSPLVRVDGDTTEHRGTGGATLFKVSGGYTDGSINQGASISADSSVIVYGVYKAGVETPIPVRLASFAGGDIQIDNGSVLAEFKSTIFQPHVDDDYDLGASSKRWKDAYIHHLHVGDITSGLTVSGGNIHLDTTGGNTFMVDVGFYISPAAAEVRLASSTIIGFSSATNVTSAVTDIAFGRNAAGIVEVNNGTLGTLRDLKARTLYGGYASSTSLFTTFAGWQNSSAPTYALLQDTTGETMINTASSYPLHFRRNNADIWSFDTSGNLVSVSGTIQLADGGTKPTCDLAHRFFVWVDAGGSGVSDTVEVCSKDSSNVYAWRTLY